MPMPADESRIRIGYSARNSPPRANQRGAITIEIAAVV